MHYLHPSAAGSAAQATCSTYDTASIESTVLAHGPTETSTCSTQSATITSARSIAYITTHASRAIVADDAMHPWKWLPLHGR